MAGDKKNPLYYSGWPFSVKYLPLYGWFLTGNCIDRQSGLKDARRGQEEGDNTE